MKLNISEYRWVLLNCNLMLGQYKGKQYAVIEPKFAKNQARLDVLLGNIAFPSIEEWNKIFHELHPKLKKQNQIRHETALRKLSGISNTKLASLNNEQRIELLDGLLIDITGKDLDILKQNRQTLVTYKNQIAVLLFGLLLPQDFLQEEDVRASQFCNRLQSVSCLKEDLENWVNLEFLQRKILAQNILCAFNDTYHTNIKLKFFDSEANVDNFLLSTKMPDSHKIITAYTEDGLLYLNKDKIAVCDNLALPAIIFHEALRIAHEQENWAKFPLIEKLLENKFKYLNVDNDSISLMNPLDAQACSMSEKIADFMLEKMQIKFVENRNPPEINRTIRQIRDKAHTYMQHQLHDHK